MKLFYCLCLTLLLVGCHRKETTEQTEPTMTYQNGHYECIEKGYGGDMLVSIEMRNNHLFTLEVEHHETPSIGGMAIEKLKDEMLRNNTYEVDSVSGATISSNALKKAVRTLFDQAKNGDYTKTYEKWENE